MSKNTSRSKDRPHYPCWRKSARFTVGSILTLVNLVGIAQDAEGQAPIRYAYAPNKVSATELEGWAHLALGCGVTSAGCRSYIKLERLSSRGPQLVGGRWATDPEWNSVTAYLVPGCNDYRTLVDSDAVGVTTADSGTMVGLSSEGPEIVHVTTSWNSGWAQICR